MKYLVLKLIQLYQNYISGLLPHSCRYAPSCSVYMTEAIQRFGVVKGGLMGIARIIRCNPWQPMGEDPVPTYFSLKRNPAGCVMDPATFEATYHRHKHSQE